MMKNGFILSILMLPLTTNMLFSQNDKTDTLTWTQQSGEVFTLVEKMPEFPGGRDSMTVFIQKNLIYPTIARENQISGKVMIQFMVDINGELQNVKALSKIGGGCEEEAIRVVKMMPKWKPGMRNDIPVKVMIRLPFNFTIR